MILDGNRQAADEFRTVDLGDKRLNRRLIRVAERLADAPQQSIPSTLEGILEPHAESTMRRAAKESTVLVLQDTTELDFTSKVLHGTSWVS